VVWRCPGRDGCGIVNGIAWSRDGRWLAYLVPVFNVTRPAAGVNVVDTATRRTWHLPITATGCRIPYDAAWSPDGLRIAYACPSRIFVVRRDLAGAPTPLDTGGVGRLSSPSWSADGTHLAFAVHSGGQIGGHSSVYIVARDGTRPRLLTSRATAPAWSPDGRLVAVRVSCGGIKLFTPGGRDVTPSSSFAGCRTIGVPGVPVWSPDGKQIAIQMRPHGGIYVVHRDGSHLANLAKAGSAADTGGGAFGGDRPAWRPTKRAPRPSRTPGHSSDL
jgi:Tol biopolymer transport system component